MNNADLLVLDQNDWDKINDQFEQLDGRQTLAEEETGKVSTRVVLIEQWQPSVEKSFTDIAATINAVVQDLGQHKTAYDQYKASVNASVKALEDGVAAHKTAYELYKSSVNASVKALEDAGKVMAPKVAALEAWRPTIDKAVTDLIAAVTKANTDRAAADAALINRVAALEAALNALKSTDATLAQKMAAAEAEVVKLKAEDVAIDLRLDKLEAPPPQPVPPLQAQAQTEETPDAPV
jgi:chromosome segregation ATPase